MLFGLSALITFAALQSQTAFRSPEEAIATLETQEKAKEAFYACIFDTNASASRNLVEATDPYFLLDGTNSAASKFAMEVSTEQVFAKCAVAISNALPNLQKMSVSFDLREYRHWAVRRIYIEKYPDARIFGKLPKPKRRFGNYGKNTDALVSHLRTVDCAVQRDPVTADWLVRNENPTDSQPDTKFLTYSRKFTYSYSNCLKKFIPDYRDIVVMNNLAGILADSLLKMSDKQR